MTRASPDNAMLVRTLFLALAIFLHHLPLVDSIRTTKHIARTRGLGAAQEKARGLPVLTVRNLNKIEDETDGVLSLNDEDLPQPPIFDRDESKRTKRSSFSKDSSKSGSRLRRSKSKKDSKSSGSQSFGFRTAGEPTPAPTCLECDDVEAIQTFIDNLEAAEFPNRSEKSRAEDRFLIFGSILIVLGLVQLTLLARKRHYRRRLLLKQDVAYEERIHGHRNLSANAMDDVEDYCGVEVVEEY